MAGAAVLEKDERPALSWQHHLGDKGHSWLHALLFLSSRVWDGDVAMPIQPPGTQGPGTLGSLPGSGCSPMPGGRGRCCAWPGLGAFLGKKGMLGVSLVQIPA